MKSYRNILIYLEDNYENFTPTQKRIIRYLENNINQASYLNADELAKKVNTNSSTVVRFCKEIGFMGYPHFQKELQNIVLKKLSGLGQYEKAKDFIFLKKDINIIKKSFFNDLKNLEDLIKEIDEKEVKKFVDFIINSRRSFIISNRSTLSLGHFFYFRIKKIIPNTFLITNYDGGFFDNLRELKKEDLVISFSFPRFTSLTIKYAEYSKKLGVKLISITSNKLSPLFKISDLCLFCPYEGVTFFTSNVAAMALINAIVCEIFIRNKKEALSNLEKEEKILFDNDILQID